MHSPLRLIKTKAAPTHYQPHEYSRATPANPFHHVAPLTLQTAIAKCHYETITSPSKLHQTTMHFHHEPSPSPPSNETAPPRTTTDLPRLKSSSALTANCTTTPVAIFTTSHHRNSSSLASCTVPYPLHATTLRHSVSTMKYEDVVADHHDLSPSCS